MKQKSLSNQTINNQPLSQDRIKLIIKSLPEQRSDLDLTGPDIDLTVIRQICAEVWNTTAEKVTGEHNKSVWAEICARTTFMEAALLFSNKSCKEIAKFCRSYGAHVSNYYNHLNTAISCSYGPQMLSICEKLSALCPGRLESFYKVIHLICIYDRIISLQSGLWYSDASKKGVNFLDRFTATKVEKNQHGDLCYAINEKSGGLWPQEFFFVAEAE